MSVSSPLSIAVASPSTETEIVHTRVFCEILANRANGLAYAMGCVLLTLLSCGKCLTLNRSSYLFVYATYHRDQLLGIGWSSAVPAERGTGPRLSLPAAYWLSCCLSNCPMDDVRLP